MTNFAKLYVPRCKHCDFCIGFWNGLVKRHYCQLKIQKQHDSVRQCFVRLDDAACERFDDKRLK